MLKAPVKQLIIDALVCARENGATTAYIPQHNIESDILTSLSFQQCNTDMHDTFHCYNYKYHEISQTRFLVLAQLEVATFIISYITW